MSDTNDTVDGLLAEFRGYSAGMPPGYHVTMSWHDFRVMLNRLEAAHEREVARLREALLKRARDNYAAGFAKGKEESDACLKPDPRWKERCEKCFENNACEPPECRYFDGEDCQSPIPNQHPMAQPGNVAAMREALKRIVAASIVAKNANAPEWILQRMADIFAMATTALAAPPRNCDRFASAEEAWDAYDEWVESYRPKGQTPPFNEFGWLFAPAAEKEGGAE